MIIKHDYSYLTLYLLLLYHVYNYSYYEDILFIRKRNGTLVNIYITEKMNKENNILRIYI